MPVVTDVDPVLQRVSDAATLGKRDAPAARQILQAAWEEADGAEQGPLHRCAIAHAMADLQDDLAAELSWDLRALEAAYLISDEDAARAGLPGTAQSFYPSLHLNLADVYRRLGENHQASEHVRLGLQTLRNLPRDGYGQMLRDGLNRVAAQLSTPGAASTA